MNFVQHSENGPAALRGTITYAVPEPMTMVALGIPALALMRRRKQRRA